MEVKVLQAGPLGVTALRDSPGAVCSWASSPASGLGPDNIDRTAVFWGGVRTMECGERRVGGGNCSLPARSPGGIPGGKYFHGRPSGGPSVEQIFTFDPPEGPKNHTESRMRRFVQPRLPARGSKVQLFPAGAPARGLGLPPGCFSSIVQN